MMDFLPKWNTMSWHCTMWCINDWGEKAAIHSAISYQNIKIMTFRPVLHKHSLWIFEGPTLTMGKCDYFLLICLPVMPSRQSVFTHSRAFFFRFRKRFRKKIMDASWSILAIFQTIKLVQSCYDSKTLLDFLILVNVLISGYQSFVLYAQRHSSKTKNYWKKPIFNFLTTLAIL